MTHDEMLAILQRAAHKLNTDVDIFPAGIQHIEIRDGGWCENSAG